MASDTGVALRNKLESLTLGKSLMRDFCQRNGLPVPDVIQIRNQVSVAEGRARANASAWYKAMTYTGCKDGQIIIRLYDAVDPLSQQQPRVWAGHIDDHTAYGIVAHELGHHVEYWKGKLLAKGPTGRPCSSIATAFRMQTGEQPITDYHPNDSEWFAEIFRLYLTNSDLLKQIRPLTYVCLRDGLKMEPVVTAPWREVLRTAPKEIVEQCERTIGGAK